MRLASRTLLVLVLCLAAFVGASAQASYFSSFLPGQTGRASAGVDGQSSATAEEDAAEAKMRALMDEATSLEMDLDDIQDADFEDLLDEDDEVDIRDVPSYEGVERPFSEAFPGEPPEGASGEEIEDGELDDQERAIEPTREEEVNIAREEPPLPREETYGFPEERDDADADADDHARMAALEVELDDLSRETFASEDAIEEEWLPSGGDGEEAPQVRAPRTFLTPRDDDVSAAKETTSREGADGDTERRRLLTSSVSGDNTLWVGFDDMPARLSDPRSGPETRIGSDHGEAHVTRAGGYWQAARFNKVERPGRRKLPPNFGKGSGEGTLLGPRGGINQHDRVGVNKASGWPNIDQLSNAGSKVSTEKYPGTPTRDPMRSLQPSVVSVTSYSPDRRGGSFAYRSRARVSKLWCVSGSDPRSCADASVFTASPHDFKEGDLVYFDKVTGSDKNVLLNPSSGTFAVNATSDDKMTFTTIPGIDSSANPLDVDVASAFVARRKRRTRRVPHPAYGQRDYAYEGGDVIYFFVTFSEPVTVTGSPALKLRTGDHFEPGAADADARFVGGGFGEKKSFWKNDERNPLKSFPGGSEARGVSSEEGSGFPFEFFDVHDGGCTLGNIQNDGPSESDCVFYSNASLSCDCAAYSGITRGGDARVRTRRVHPFVPGDLVVLRGATGDDADLLNKAHAVGTVSGTGGVSSGNDLFTFEPPLNLTDRSFDARFVSVGRINKGQECRAASAGMAAGGGGPPHGSGFCVFGSESSNFFEENRREQYMDNVLAFAFVVNASSGTPAIEEYDQADATRAPWNPHLSARLEYYDQNALTMDSETTSVKRACVDVFQIKHIECGVNTVLTVYGKHRLLPGDYVALEGVGVTDVSLAASVMKTWNSQHKVHALPVDSGLAGDRVDWSVIWDASPHWGPDVSKFQIDLNTTAGTGLCAANGGTDGTDPPSVTRSKSRVRKTRDANVAVLNGAGFDSKRRCVFADASLTLPRPGLASSGTAGYAQSLGFNKDIKIGRAFVVRVSARAISGSVFGYNGGGGIPPNRGSDAARNVAGVDILEIAVSFSEPVYASCGADDGHWATLEQAPGVRIVACESVRLKLKTSPESAVAGSMNFDSTTGTFGGSVFPTGFLLPPEWKEDARDRTRSSGGLDPPNAFGNELVFAYLPRRGDNVTDFPLQYIDEFALEVGCAVFGVGNACDSPSRVRRVADNAPVSTRLPPTRRDAGRCVHGPDLRGMPQCASATADHRRSLAGTARVFVDAAF
jgi:hypothetical protein